MDLIGTSSLYWVIKYIIPDIKMFLLKTFSFNMLWDLLFIILYFCLALKVSFIGKAETRFQHEKTETQPNGESRNFMDDVTGEEMFFEYHYNILGGSGKYLGTFLSFK